MVRRVSRDDPGKDQSEERWRVFCAIDLPQDLHESFREHIDRLREAVPQARASWSRAENIHLTIKFLGEIPESRIQDLSNAAGHAVEGVQPFDITVQQTGAFPNHGLPRVLWIGISDESAELAGLHSRLEDKCAAVGFPKEGRPFHPHFTLARLRRPKGVRSLVEAHKALTFDPVKVRVEELLVIRSELRSQGSLYTTISRHPLRGS